MISFEKQLVPILGMVFLGACTVTPSTHIQGPMTVRPPDLHTPDLPDTGAIFHTNYGQHPLFEDVRARNVGDTLDIVLQETTTANEKNGADATHASTLATTTPTITNTATGQHVLDSVSATGSSANKLATTGDSSGSNILTGAITVTVIRVLGNGNLQVSGEKLVSINQMDEYVRISGVVNPVNIQAGNSVLSSQIADARIEYKGANANYDAASIVSMFSRFFASALPF